MTKSKPTLVTIGENFVDPNDVASVVKVRSKTDLYIIRLKSQPNAEYPFWASGEDVAKLLKYFNVKG